MKDFNSVINFIEKNLNDNYGQVSVRWCTDMIKDEIINTLPYVVFADNYDGEGKKVIDEQFGTRTDTGCLATFQVKVYRESDEMTINYIAIIKQIF